MLDEEYYNFHGLFADDLTLVNSVLPDLNQKLNIIPFFKVYLEQSVNNRLFYQWTRFSLDERIGLGITDDKPVELTALRLLLGDETLDFIRLPLRDLETTAPIYLGRGNYVWTSHPYQVNPTFRADQIRPDFYIVTTDIFVPPTKLPLITMPERTHQSTRKFDDTSVHETYFFWQNLEKHSVVFTDPNDICISGTTYYSSNVEKDLVVNRKSYLRKMASIRIATRNVPNDSFIFDILNECNVFKGHQEDMSEPLRELRFIFPYHKPFIVNHEGDNPLVSGMVLQLQSMVYDRKVTPQAQVLRTIQAIVRAETNQDVKGIALLVNPREISSAHIFNAYVIGSTEVSSVVIVDARYNKIYLHNGGTLVDEVNSLFIKDHQNMHDALILFCDKTESTDCVYNGIFWGKSLPNGLVALNSHLAYAGDCSHRNIHYLANPFITTTGKDIKRLCKRSVAWRIGSFYVVPAENDAYIVLPEICDDAKLSVENGPSMSSGSLLFLARLQEHYKMTKDLFGSMPEARLHIEKLLTASFVFYFDIRRNSSLPLHEFDKVPMVNEQHKMFLQESPHAAAAYRTENQCVVT
ncbi:hypothetical protein HDE_04247 [Halotydeus destructor]|nr:hypothetical protein HDE_04247 [Halotydeus destructor]